MQRGLLSKKTKPKASAPKSTAAIASSRFVIPHILTFTRILRPLNSLEFIDLYLHIICFHKNCSNKYRINACILKFQDIVSRFDTALTYNYLMRRNFYFQIQGRIEID